MAAALGLACAACGAPHAHDHVASAHATGAPASGTSLSPEAIASVVKGANSRFQGCLFLANSPESHGSVKVSFDVATSGKVSEAHLDSASFPDKPVVRCVVKQMQRLQFPEATAETSATWTFAFEHPAGR